MTLVLIQESDWHNLEMQLTSHTIRDQSLAVSWKPGYRYHKLFTYVIHTSPPSSMIFSLIFTYEIAKKVLAVKACVRTHIAS